MYMGFSITPMWILRTNAWVCSPSYTTLGLRTETVDLQDPHQYTDSCWLLFFQEGIEVVIKMVDGLVNSLTAQYSLLCIQVADE